MKGGPSPSPRLVQVLAAYVCVAVVFLSLDSIWLSMMGTRLYRPAIGHLMREGFDTVAAAAFYLVYFTGLIAFVVLPSKTVRMAALRGAGFGLVAYATYDLTNQATLRGWPWEVTAADLAWGAFASAIAGLIACVALRALRR